MLWHREPRLVPKYVGTSLSPSEGSPQICTEVGESEFFNGEMQIATVRLIQANRAAEPPVEPRWIFKGPCCVKRGASAELGQLPKCHSVSFFRDPLSLIYVMACENFVPRKAESKQLFGMCHFSKFACQSFSYEDGGSCNLECLHCCINCIVLSQLLINGAITIQINYCGYIQKMQPDKNLS